MSGRRIAIACCVALAASAPALIAAGEDERGRDQVAAVFDSASSLIPGNDVNVAGVAVGTVDAIDLTEDKRARVVMSIDRRYTPFHDDAECELGTKLLLGEKSVDCDPGDPRRPLLAPGDEGIPTVPVEQTSAPVDLDLVLAGARLPYRQRLQIVLNEIGALATARGEDVNEVIRRASPALRDAREVFEILDDQRAELKQALTDSDTVLAALAEDPDRIGGLVRETRNVTRRTAAHADDLDRTIAGLPPLLAQARPSLAALDELTRKATPVARGLRRSAPSLTGIANELEPFADRADPALETLGDSAAVGRSAVADSLASVDALAPAARRLRSTLDEAIPLLDNLAKRGGREATLRYVFNVMRSVARFDRWSHIVPVRGTLNPCSSYNTGEPLEGCLARYDTDGEPSLASGRERSPGGRDDRRGGGRGAARAARGARSGEDGGDAGGLGEVADLVGEALRRTGEAVRGAGDRARRAAEGTVRRAGDGARDLRGGVDRADGELLDFLLGP